MIMEWFYMIINAMIPDIPHFYVVNGSVLFSGISICEASQDVVFAKNIQLNLYQLIILIDMLI